MRSRSYLCVLALVALLSCKSSEQKSVPAPAAKIVNVVVVTIDTLRADHLHCYGDSKIETPTLDGLAQRGALFENATAQAPLTAPSHASIFTGQNPNVHGVRSTGGFVLPTSATTLATVLKAKGWDTAAFIGSAVLKKAFGLNLGFTVYDDQMPKAPKTLQYGVFAERSAGQVVDRAVEWLNGQSGKPFFLWVHVYDPHSPYDPPAPYKQKYAGRPYDGEIAYADHELARLFDAVGRKAPSNTLIVAMADHGESLGDHGEYGHGVFLYDATLRIPLIMVGPGIPAGLRVQGQARTIDVLPTILGMMGDKPPATVQGTSLAPAFSGKPLPVTISYSETLFTKINLGWAELRALRTNDWKYIQAPKPELYNLPQDAAEAKNVIQDRPKETQQFLAQMSSITGVNKGAENIKTALADKRTMDQLRSLGYVSDFAPRQFELSGKGIDPKDRLDVLKLEYLAVTDPATTGPQRIAYLRKAIDLDPTNSLMYSHLGVAYTRDGRFDDALKLYLEAIRKGVDSPKLYACVGDLYLQQGNKDEAIVYYEKAAKVDPTDVEAADNLAMAYIEKGRADDAERIYRQVLVNDDRNADAYNGLGMIAVQKNQLGEAQKSFERALEFNPDLLEARLNLGVVYKKTGDRARARASFEAFLAKASPKQYANVIPLIKEQVEQLR